MHILFVGEIFCNSYAKVGDARALASVIGEDELSPTDKKYLEFGKAFEAEFVGQGLGVNRNIIETLNLGWKLIVSRESFTNAVLHKTGKRRKNINWRIYTLSVKRAVQWTLKS